MTGKYADRRAAERQEASSQARTGGVNRRRFLGIGTTLLAAGLIPSVGNAAGNLPGIDAGKKIVRLGAFAPITGPVPFYAMINHATDAYFKDLNERGGIQGWKFQYVIRDDAYDPANSLAVTRRLVEEDDVFALVASNGTANNIAIIPYARSKNLPVIAPSGGSPKLNAQPNMFPLLPDYALSASSSARYALETLKKQKIALIWLNGELGLRAKVGLDLYLKERGSKLISDASFDVSASDLTAQVQQVTAAGAEVIMLFGSNAQLASALRSAQRIGWKGKWFAPFFVADPSTYDLTGDLLDGVLFSSWLLPVDADGEQIAAYRKAVGKYYPNDKVGVFGLNGWTAAALFAYAFEKMVASGRPLTRGNLIAVMNTLHGISVGAASNISFEVGDHRGTRAEAMVLAQNGKFIVAHDFQPYPEAVFKAVAG